MLGYYSDCASEEDPFIAKEEEKDHPRPKPADFEHWGLSPYHFLFKNGQSQLVERKMQKDEPKRLPQPVKRPKPADWDNWGLPVVSWWKQYNNLWGDKRPKED